MVIMTSRNQQTSVFLLLLAVIREFFSGMRKDLRDVIYE